MKAIRLLAILFLAVLSVPKAPAFVRAAAVDNVAGAASHENGELGLVGRPDAWRYKWYENQWWYYRSNNTWLVWNGSAWLPYTNANQEVGSLVRGYPFGNGYYGNRYYANGYRANPQFYRNAAPYYGNPYNYGFTPWGPAFGSVVGSTAVIRGAIGGIAAPGR